MRILVGISGSIGVLGIHSYLLDLRSQPEVEEVRVIMTPTAARFVSPRAIEAILGQTVHVDAWSDSGPMTSPPILLKDIDLYLVAPASATTLSRCAAGLAETLVAHCYLSFVGAVAFAPAMAPEMLEHPATQRNLSHLKEFGATILPCGMGYSAATGKRLRGALCPFPQMWPTLRSIVEESRAETGSKGT